MTDQENSSQVTNNRFFKTIFRVLLYIILFFAGIILLIRTPAFQTYLADRATAYLESKTNFHAEIEFIEIDGIRSATIKNAVVLDQSKDTMISVGSLSLKFSWSNLISDKEISVEKVILDKPFVHLVWIEESTMMNISKFIRAIKENFLLPQKDQPYDPNYKKKQIVIESATITDGAFAYSDLRHPEMENPNRFDHFRFRLDDIDATINEFALRGDTMIIDVDHLNTIETKHNFHVYHLGLLYRFSPRFMDFQNIQGEVENTCLSEYLRFDYGTIPRLRWFNDSVTITAKLDNSVIQTKDLTFFAPTVGKYHDIWRLSGEFEGGVKDFVATDVKAYFGKQSSLFGRMKVVGFPNIKETDFQLPIKGKVLPQDLSPYVPASAQETLNKLGKTAYNLNFLGKTNAFDVTGDFNADSVGKFNLDLSMDLFEGKNVYDFNLKTESLSLKNIAPNKYVNDFAGDIHVHGHDFEKKTAVFYYDTHFNEINMPKAKVNDVDLKGIYNVGSFSIDLDARDDQFTAKGKSYFEIKDGEEHLKVKCDAPHIDLRALGLVKDSAYIKTNLNIDIYGEHIDDFKGSGIITDTRIFFKNDSAKINEFQFYSEQEPGYRSLLINSDILHAELIGDYSFTQLIREINFAKEEFNYSLNNDSIALVDFYERKKLTDSIHYHIDFNAQFQDVNPILKLFAKEWSISEGSRINGYYTKKEETDLYLDLSTKSIGYDDFEFDDVSLKVEKYFQRDSVNDFKAELLSSEQRWKDKPYYENLDVLLDWKKSHLDFGLNVKQFQKSNHLDITGKADFYKAVTKIMLDESDISILNKEWKLDTGNVITLTKNRVDFEQVRIYHSDQEIDLNGYLSSNHQDSAVAAIKNFDLSNVNDFIDTKLEGRLNGEVYLNDNIEKVDLKASVLLDSLEVNDQLVGDLKGDWNYNNLDEKLFLDVDLHSIDSNSLHLNGYVDVKDSSKSVKIDADLTHFGLHILEAFLSDYASGIKGEANGKVKILGTLKEPLFFGKPKVTGGEFKINYLNTVYKFDDRVVFSHDSIFVVNTVLTDTLWGTKGVLNGGLTHKFFRDYEIFTDLTLNKTFVLNTQEGDNDLYYGNAFASGKIKMFGPTASLKMKSQNLRSEEGTKLSIPLESKSTIDEKEYIEFVKEVHTDDFIVEEEKEVSLSGIEMEINFDITPDAEFEIIFDKKAGDIVRGNGDGNILIQVDTRGDFKMYGDFRFKKGTYNFTLVNLINKAFKISQGSSIIWNGDPYTGEADITAIHTVNASLLPILTVDSTFYDQHPDVKRRVPVDVILGLKGPLLGPEITFDVDIRQYPNYIEVEQAILDIESRMEYNEQLLNQEVFSLMVLKQLSPVGQLNVNLASSYANSVSEMLSNQFSYWVSQFDENLEVYIDVAGFEKDQSSSFSLSMSYSILDGRIRISNEGSFRNVQDQESIANAFGDWTLEYLITDDGKIRVKAYNKTNQNTVSTSLSNNNTTVYGASLMYTQGFDNLGELFKRNKNKKQVTEFETDEGVKEEDDLIENEVEEEIKPAEDEK